MKVTKTVASVRRPQTKLLVFHINHTNLLMKLMQPQAHAAFNLSVKVILSHANTNLSKQWFLYWRLIMLVQFSARAAALKHYPSL